MSHPPPFTHASQWGEPCLKWLIAHQPFDAAHDLQHLQRVTRTALRLGEGEGTRVDVLEPAAWLHDCVIVPKNSPQRAMASRMAAERAASALQELAYPEELMPDLCHAIEAHSFSAGIPPTSIEAAVLRDADRLDALGATGIYRVIAAGVTMQRPLYQADDPFCKTREADDGTSIVDHFYTKLLGLVDGMLTDSGRKEARQRRDAMQGWLDQLAREIA